MGLDFGKYCKCGPEYGMYGLAPAADCGKVCEGDGSPTCGGYFKVAAYKIYPDGPSRNAPFSNVFMSEGQQLGRVATATRMAVRSHAMCAARCLTSAPCWGFVWIEGNVENCELISATGSPANYTIPAGGKYYHL
ncbi:PREDICTED: uncharacterized protein LOC106818298 [Priapulus caudatus]|uniref:Uncharacterized protein LOC106818298 n=1 Tax=Priapulus caudatus TaxID=37621 RepID=A0ABM1F235_PRICU|nr:PREDICTED: uncharacterized protein LOC106818298 [Priapulus caudatus]